MDQDASRGERSGVVPGPADSAGLDKQALLGRIVAATDELQYRFDLKSRARERVTAATHGAAPRAAAAVAAVAALGLAVRKRRHRD
jgi:hypothetical protein